MKLLTGHYRLSLLCASLLTASLSAHADYLPGWCDEFTSTGHWQRMSEDITKELCTGEQRIWQTQVPINSQTGQCEKHNQGQWKAYTMALDQRYCEQLDAKSSQQDTDWYRWNSTYPMIYGGINNRGFGVEVSRSISSLAKDQNSSMLAGRIASYHLPDGWAVRFFNEENFQGEYRTRDNNDENGMNTPWGEEVKSIQILRQP